MASHISILKTLLNLKGVLIDNFEFFSSEQHKNNETYTEISLHINVRPHKRLQCRCPKCKKKVSGYDHKSSQPSSWRAPNLNGIPVYLQYNPARIECPEHGILTEYLPWTDGRSRFTEDFNNEIAWMITKLSRTSIAEYFNINWRTVGNCVKAAKDRIEPDVSVRLHGLKRICVDETSYSKGHQYITVVYDMDTNRVVWVHDKHGQSVFETFCQLLTEQERNAIEVVAGDGARWIDSCVKKYFPNAIRCVDFFHVVTWINEALDKVRIGTSAKASREYNRQKEEFRQAEQKAREAEAEAVKKRSETKSELEKLPKQGRPSKRKKELQKILAEFEKAETSDRTEPQKGAGRPKKEQFSEEHQTILDNLKTTASDIKGTKYALGKNPENRTKNQDDMISLIENSYPDLYMAYQRKESLRLILHMKDVELAEVKLDEWILDAGSCGLPPIAELSEKIKRHRQNILNAISNQVNSAKSESANTTIKVLIKMARGFRNLENLIALIYLKCSDLVVPLNNRYQASAEKKAEMREYSNKLRQLRQEERRESLA